MQKIIFKKFLKEIKQTAVVVLVFTAVFAVAWLAMPTCPARANGAEAAFGCDK